MAEISFWRILLAAILFAVIAYIIHSIGAIVGMPFYTDPQYNGVWSNLMMPVAGPPPAEFAYTSFVFSLITGVMFALVYSVIGRCMVGKTIVVKGIFYGFLIFLVAGIPGALSLYLLINLPQTLIALWAFENLVVYLLGGITIAWVIGD